MYFAEPKQGRYSRAARSTEQVKYIKYRDYIVYAETAQGKRCASLIF